MSTQIMWLFVTLILIILPTDTKKYNIHDDLLLHVIVWLLIDHFMSKEKHYPPNNIAKDIRQCDTLDNLWIFLLVKDSFQG